MRLHGSKETEQIGFSGRGELRGNVDIGEAERFHGTRLVGQRVARIVVKREVDDRGEA